MFHFLSANLLIIFLVSQFNLTINFSIISTGYFLISLLITWLTYPEIVIRTSVRKASAYITYVNLFITKSSKRFMHGRPN